MALKLATLAMTNSTSHHMSQLVALNGPLQVLPSMPSLLKDAPDGNPTAGLLH